MCFNPRTREGCDCCVCEVLRAVQAASIHAPAKGATTLRFTITRSRACFNPRTREGCDALYSTRFMSSQVLQSTHPRRVRRRGLTPSLTVSLLQSTHPRRVRLSGVMMGLSSSLLQSTHPRRVRRSVLQLRLHLRQASIHAPAKGATSCGAWLSRRHTSFNPRTREGCDSFQNRVLTAGCCFNPRTREGCDAQKRRTLHRRLCFNPRTREGCDVLQTQGQPSAESFNPRTREGCDVLRICSLQLIVASIHAPAKGATLQLLRGQSHGRASIHAPAKGATVLIGEHQHTRRASIHAPAKGATTVGWSAPKSMEQLQSTHPRRGRLSDLRTSGTFSSKLQSTHPRRVRRGTLVSPVSGSIASIHAPAKGATAFLNY